MPLWQDWLTSRVANIIAVVIFVLAGIAAIVFIHRYAVDVVYSDQWKDVDLIHRLDLGTLSFWNLWAQHNENRILIPNLVVLAIGSTTHLQVLVEDYLSGVTLFVSTALIVLAHRRRSPGMPLIAYCPVVVVLLSYAVVGDALFGFNLSWFLVILALATAVFLADRVDLSRLAIAGALAAAVLGSYSSLQGLLIWPAVLALLWLRRRPTGVLMVWIAGAVVTTLVYFYRFSFAQAGTQDQSSVAGIGKIGKFFIAEFGNVLGGQLTFDDELLLGAIVLAVSLVALVLGRHRTDADGAAVGVALIVFTLIFAASASVGRLSFGLVAAGRYAPFVLVGWVGSYLVLLSRVTATVELPESTGVTPAALDGSVTGWRGRRRQVVGAFFAGLLLLMGLQVVLAIGQGTNSAAGWHAEELAIANVTANINDASDGLVGATLGTYPVPYIRSMARAAREDHLSLFSTSLGADEQRAGINPDLLTIVDRPFNGQYLSGKVYVDCAAWQKHLTAVQFVVTGHGLVRAVIATGITTYYGYLNHWDTTTVPNGVYALSCRARVASGRQYMSAPIGVIVDNGS